jgi:putative ABC transport system permease protein
MIFDYAYKELKNNKKFLFGFAFNLALGLWALILLDSFNVSFNEIIGARAKNLLTSDISVFARRKLTEQELKTLDQTINSYQVDKSLVVEVYSMVRSDSSSRLSELRIVESNYPFYGEVTVKDQGKVNFSKINKERLVWLAPELLLQLKSKIGDELKIGCQKFKIDGVINSDTASSWRGVSLAPRIFLGGAHLKEMCLTGVGSTAHYAHGYKLKTGIELNTVVKQLEEKLTDPAIKIVTPSKASQQVSRVLNYLSDYLGLVALSAIFLACIGSVYLFRSFVNRKIKDVAILKSIGLIHSKIRMKFLYQLLILGFSGWLISICLAQVTLPILNYFVGSRLELALSNIIPFKVSVVGLLIATLASIISCFPLLLSLEGMKANELFQERPLSSLKINFKVLLNYLPAFLFFLVLAIFQAKSIKMGSLFFGVFAGSFIILLLVLSAVLKRLGSRVMGASLWSKAYTYIYRKPISSISTFLSLSLGVMLFSLVGQVEVGLKNELDFSNKGKSPALFLFDIQEEQVEGLKQLASSSQVELNALSPMVRARLVKINDKAVLREQEEALETRESATRRRFRNRGINLTFRESLNPSEELIDGRLFKGVYVEDEKKLPEISLEQRYAKRLEVSLGDTMTFDILGVEMKGVITSLRKVKWTSFEPNFFILFQPGAIDLAPKTYLASVNDLAIDKKISFQNDLVDKFSNISVVDITKVVSRILEVFDHMSLALSFMGVFCLIVGYMVLFSIVTSQISQRKRDIALFKTLGMNFSQINKMIAIEFISIISLSFVVGIGLSLVSSFIVAKSLFDSAWGVNVNNLLVMFSFMIVFCFSIIRVASNRVLQNKVVDQLYS